MKEDVSRPLVEVGTSHQSLSDWFHLCRDKGYGCALYRLPKSHRKVLVIDLDGGTSLDKVDLEELDPGFVFHPFSSEKHPIRYLRNNIVVTESDQLNGKESIQSNIPQEKLDELILDLGSSSPTNKSSVAEIKSINGKDDRSLFIELVQSTIEQIHVGKFQKAVLARTKELQLPQGFDPVPFFDDLCSNYQNAFISLTSFPDEGYWIGATPETLIDINPENQFKTVALAATQGYNPELDLEDNTWSQKDIEEQAMVSRYIINCFKRIRLREFEEVGPRTFYSGNLIHLKTDYLVDLNQVNFPQLGTVMLQLLHPTSAVCGMPKEASFEFIMNNEEFDRSYFCGYLGPVKLFDQTNIFVNLRCMKIDAGRANLYAGAGIISNSKPEKEWKETEIKMNTLLQVLKKHA